MKPIVTIVLFCTLLLSCYKPYNAAIEAEEDILVVEGMITNEATVYNIRLSYASSFKSGSLYRSVTSAIVYVTDDLGNIFPFGEKNNGNYTSDPSHFTGHPGRSYILHITTSDGEIYESAPQKLFPGESPDGAYAEYGYEETLTRFNQLIITIRGASILLDITNNSDTLPRYRFTSDLVKQYFYALQIPPGDRSPLYSFYCWQTESANPDINLTGGAYSANSTSINKHVACFLDYSLYFEAFVYGLGLRNPDMSYNPVMSAQRQTYLVMNRILYLNQFTLNEESYLYYKSMDDQLRSEGKLFDPIAVQLKSNIKSIKDPGKKVIGFFEASSVSHIAYLVDFRNLTNGQPSVIKTPYILPPSLNGCRIDKAPPFWIPK